jgi:hypothetical protein
MLVIITDPVNLLKKFNHAFIRIQNKLDAYQFKQTKGSSSHQFEGWTYFLA